MDEKIEIRAVVKGRVQGVGFRITTRNHAIRLGLVGTVRNLPDGCVEIYASGKRSVVDTLLKLLREDFVGNVTAIYSEELSYQHMNNTFTIVQI